VLLDAVHVRAYVFLCMLAYYVEWHMREKLKPMLFDDEYVEQARAARPSPVARARRSDQAKPKMRPDLARMACRFMASVRCLMTARLAYNACHTPSTRKQRSS